MNKVINAIKNAQTEGNIIKLIGRKVCGIKTNRNIKTNRTAWVMECHGPKNFSPSFFTLSLKSLKINACSSPSRNSFVT